MFGSSETKPGGLALKFYSSVRFDIRKIGAIKAGQEILGSQTRVRVLKNKVSPPFRDAEFDIICGEGISLVGDLFEMDLKSEVITNSGAWYSFNNEIIGHGRESAKTFLKEHPMFYQNIVARFRETLISSKKEFEMSETVLVESKKDILAPKKVNIEVLH